MKFEKFDPPVQKAPIAAGLLIVAAGALLMRAHPHLFEFPELEEREIDPKGRLEMGDRLGAIAQGGRDNLMKFLPSNLFEWIGRGLITLGSLVVLTRLLDRLVDDDDITD